MRMEIVQVQKGYKYYEASKERNVILNHIDLTVHKGTIYGLLGASGCGKTTLLSCIIGIKKLNGGHISILGGSPDKSILGNRIGYMPQEITLLPEFTIEETLYYFGRIYGMTANEISDRYYTLRKLLELPYDDKYIKQLSGGQQRSVSLAASMVHQPELLILDEPTVGLDPLLREKMWNFLNDISRSQKTTVIITTHYIEETKQADCIGIMRNGTLLIENSPSKIMLQLETNSMEEAFYNLCLRQEAKNNSKNAQEEIITIESGATFDKESSAKALKYNAIEENPAKSYKSSSMNKIRALLMKNIISLIRQPIGLFAVLYFPIMGVIALLLIVGDFKNIPIGIVNEETLGFRQCLYENGLAYNSSYECNLEMISCRFISYINDTKFTKVFYDSYQKAFDDYKTRNIYGFIHITSNYTSSLSQLISLHTSADPASIDNAEIQVLHDRFDFPFYAFFQKNLLFSFRDFFKSILTDCGISEKLGSFGYNFEEPIYGKMEGSFTDNIVVSTMPFFAFYFAMLCSCTVFISERLDGIWHRTLVAGVTTTQMLASHIVCSFATVLVQCLEISALILYFFEMGNGNYGENVTIILLLLLNGICGMFFGIFISAICKSHFESNLTSLGTILTLVLLSGILWPIAGMPKYLSYFPQIFPTSLSAEACTAIINKGWNIAHFPVWKAFVATSIWTLALLVLSLFKLNRISKN